jgi:magnesium chelatase family protein
LSLDEAIEVTKIYSAARLLSADCPLITQRPFRSPHHTASDIALAGGGVYPRPGELSLSHNGVLFLDEINEFHRNALEVLRQPLERGFVTISRASGAIDYPTRIILAAAMNPCPCGYLGDSVRDCSCTPQQIRGYRNKLSGPLRDRIDIHLSVARLPADQLMRTQKAETTLEVRKRVEAARERQSKRYADTGIRSNATLRPAAIKTYCKLDDQSEQFLVQAVERLGLTARSYMKVIKVARTIADIGDEDRIRLAHVAEAVQYRGLDRRIGA